MTSNPQNFRAMAERAVEMIPDGSVLGLGTGHAATEFIKVLGERVRAGLRVRGLPTSQVSADLARQLGIPLTTFEEVDVLDVDVDGADEVDPQGNLIKGYGGALLREKIVAEASRRLIILVGPEKLVPRLGAHKKLPVEVVTFGLAPCSRRLAALGCVPTLREVTKGKPFVTDNGNFILDCQIGHLERPAEWEQSARAIAGVVGTGLFLGMNPTVLIQDGDRVEVRQGSKS
jgi:ribose 5-phosphate isomerase A